MNGPQGTEDAAALGPRVATYNHHHKAVVNADGTIDIHRRQDAHTTDGTQQKACAAFKNINARNAEFWKRREGIPEQ